MKICFFGIYDPEYSRNRILMSGLQANGVTVLESRIDSKKSKGYKKYFDLYKAGKAIKKENPDYILVAFPGQTVVWLARLLFPKKKIIFDAFVSLYDSNVCDRKLYSLYSLRGLRDFYLDKIACKLAGLVLLDTEAHIKYFSATFNIRESKFIRVPVGANTAVFYPREEKKEPGKFTVYFHGNFIPLQGIEYILEAAQILKDENIIFNIIGTGQKYGEMLKVARENNLSNVMFLGRKLLTELPQHISASDVCLGIFGNTEKTQRVIPNKVFECLAMRKPVITGDTPAIREFMADGKNIVLCPVANSRALAEKIMYVKANTAAAGEIAKVGYNLIHTQLNEKEIARELLISIQKRQ
jgi:glycosyltransferase involved in cell wall biosynthesis